MLPSQFTRQLLSHLRRGGLPWLLSAVQTRIWPVRATLAPAVRTILQNKVGLEIGGPSAVFSSRGILPVYSRVERIDNVNFTAQTAWETGLRDGGDFIFDSKKPHGRQYLREATDLSGIADASYDFLLSSHCLEHVANPLAALREWHRVTRNGGHLLLILPGPTGTFDHRRPITTLEHLRHDFDRNVGEDDLTHLPEILALHDLARDPPAGSADQFRTRSLRNLENRCLHHHVFDLALMGKVLRETGWNVLLTEQVQPIHLVALAKKETLV